MLALLFVGVLAAPRADADPLQLGPFSVSDVFVTPSCSPACTPSDFPQDLGVVGTFTYALTPGDVVTDILVEGVWGGTNAHTAPVEVYLRSALVATCTASDVCITDPTGRVEFNGGAGFQLSDLAVDLADFQGDDAALSLIQTGTAGEDSVDLSDLQITVFVERDCMPEICDGFDNDCDQQVDEGIAAMQSSCGVGECSGNSGAIVCQDGMLVDNCDPVAGAVAELCNGLDDDCNGLADDGVADLVSGSDVGECQSEIQSCVGGVFEVIQAGIEPAAELCNGLDDDCNATADDGVADLVSGTNVGECQTEIQSCVGGVFEVTQAGIGPAAEVCNGLDDDCNSILDDGVADLVSGTDVGECQSEIQSCVGGVFEVTQAGIEPAAEVCNDLDDDCNSIPDDGVADLVSGTDVGECQSEIQSCVGGVFEVTQAGIEPAAEVCNGLDDDCNATADDGVADLVSGTDVGECQSEIQSCIGGVFEVTQVEIGPAVEVCNGLDDDCNETADDGVADLVSGTNVGECQSEIQSCIGGVFEVTQVGIGPAAEVCNGLDDDCNSILDDGVGDLVSGTDVGECQSEIQSCVGGVFEVAQAGIGPAAEVCNGLDDDCNAMADDGVADLVSGTNVGECQTEIQSCIGGVFEVTQAGIGPAAEVCNGLDDDCNSILDDGVADLVSGTDVGECQSEIQTCVGGVFEVTQAGIEPAAEVCNGLDDDCNAMADDGVADLVSGTDVGQCQSEIQSCIDGSFQVTQSGVPPRNEVCNGLDEDCNGVADNGVAELVSGSDVGECQTEIQSCIGGSFQITQTGIGPSVEVCNGLDENCSGVADDGVGDLVSGTDVGECQSEIQSCIGGAFEVTQAGIGPAAEVCNGLDEDCNGLADNGVADLVSGSDVGECQSEIQSCIGGAFQVTQTGIGPGTETCNGLDDDCNSLPDDAIADIVSGSDVGECQSEIQSCIDGSFQVTQTAIPPGAETCNGLDDDCDSLPDDDIADIVTGSDVGECRTGIQSCIDGSFQITQVGIPPAPETCNGLDDDCDTVADDNLADIVTGSDIGECQTEIQSCIDGSFQVTQTAILPVAETCNGLDDDCDTEPDDNVPDIVINTDIGQCQAEIQSCIDGTFQITQTGVGPAPEQCNGLDDDCDEGVDEDIADRMNGSDVGECQAEIESCIGGVFEVVQTAIGPTIETCNGLDDDCDTVADDNLADIVTGSDVGECRTEIQSCVGGSFEVTQAGVGPAAEICNGLDDDCNAQPDDGVDPIATGSDIGECRAEIQECMGGTFGVTQTGIGPVPETCDGLDENCNSIVDDVADIVTGSDVGACRPEIQKCLGGTFQVTQTEISPAAEICNGVDDDCDGADDDGVADIVTGSNVGECQPEIQSCIGGRFQVAQALIAPTVEACNGLDDDCNGAADNGFGPITCGLGVCESTVESCVSGVPQSCEPLPGPGEEFCLDGGDDDCDGGVDDDDVCELVGFDAFAGDLELSRVSGRDLVLVAAETGGLRLLEFTPLGPGQVGSLDPDTCKDGFATVVASVQDVDSESVGDFAYLAAGPCGFWVAELDGAIGSPNWIAAVDTPGFALDVEVEEEDLLLYVADVNGGLEIYDVTQPDAPQPLGQVGRANANFGGAIDVDLFEGLAYVATTRGLRIVDPSNPSAPMLIGVFDTPAGTGPGQDVEVVPWGGETHAYLAAFQEGVYILDVTDPTLPESIGWMPSRVPGTSPVYEVTVAGRRAFLAEDNPLLRIFDVSDPTDPVELDPFLAGGHVWDIAVKDAVAYLALGEDPFGATPGAQAVHVSQMGLSPEDVLPAPEPSVAQAVAAALATLLWLRARVRPRRGRGPRAARQR